MIEIENKSISPAIFSPASLLEKCPTGIDGFDEITEGGLPKGRCTLLCGGAGCGKTLMAMEFLARGSERFDEPGVFISFEETVEDLAVNFASIGFDIQTLVDQKKLVIEHVQIERSDLEETGEFNLDGLFIRLAYALQSTGAVRVALDTIEALFAGFSDESILRAELRRLFKWLKNQGVTALITAEAGTDTLTRNGIEEYVADCVIMLDNRLETQVATRRLRIIKYRGSTHGPDEYPFLISRNGVSVIPLSSADLDHEATSERVSSGIPDLDEMLEGKGFYRGSSILVTGKAGTGKTSIAASFVAAACARGERAVYFSLEESRSQVVRNMKSIGIDFLPWMEKGLLTLISMRPWFFNLEMHLATKHAAIREIEPQVVALDPVSCYVSAGTPMQARAMITRLVDFMKERQITVIFTDLTGAGDDEGSTEVSISSLMDTWIVLHRLENSHYRKRGLSLVKSRGMNHSNSLRELLMSENGIRLREIVPSQRL